MGYYIMLAGNPGVGKSTTLNTLVKGVVFKTGFSLGTGLTQELQIHCCDGYCYIDTPGFYDISGEDNAANNIESGLKKDGQYKLIFVLEQTSAHSMQDINMLNKILDCITCPFEFAVIVNKCASAFMNAASFKAFETSLNSELHKKCSKFLYVPKFPNMDCAEDISEYPLEWRNKVATFVSNLSFWTIHPYNIAEIQTPKRVAAKIEEARKEKERLAKEAAVAQAAAKKKQEEMDALKRQTQQVQFQINNFSSNSGGDSGCAIL